MDRDAAAELGQPRYLGHMARRFCVAVKPTEVVVPSNVLEIALLNSREQHGPGPLVWERTGCAHNQIEPVNVTHNVVALFPQAESGGRDFIVKKLQSQR